MNGLIDRDDMPPRKRAPLPTKKQIEAIADIPALVEIEQEVERRAEKITVDLEMEVGDEDWDARARGALTAHRICLKAIRKRLHRLRVGGKPTQAETDDARLEKKVQKAEALASVKSSEAERKRAKAAQASAAVLAQQLALIKRTSFFMHFHAAACEALQRDQLRAIEAAAGAALLESITLIETPDQAANHDGPKLAGVAQ